MPRSLTSNDTASDEVTFEGHDYMWARLPFLVPMAAKIGRTCCRTGPECGRLAQLVDQLHSLALRHLEREERLLARLSASRDDRLTIDTLTSLSTEHRELLQLLGRVCVTAGLPETPHDDACPTVHAFHHELRSLDQHLRDQIRIEDEILGSHIAAAHGGTSGDHARHDATRRETR